MANLLQPTNTNHENLEAFIAAIDDSDLREIVKNHFELVLEIGKPASQGDRKIFFEALQELIDKRIGESNL